MDYDTCVMCLYVFMCTCVHACVHARVCRRRRLRLPCRSPVRGSRHGSPLADFRSPYHRGGVEGQEDREGLRYLREREQERERERAKELEASRVKEKEGWERDRERERAERKELESALAKLLEEREATAGGRGGEGAVVDGNTREGGGGNGGVDGERHRRLVERFRLVTSGKCLVL